MASLPPATCGEDNPWSCGLFQKDARRPLRSTSSSTPTRNPCCGTSARWSSQSTPRGLFLEQLQALFDPPVSPPHTDVALARPSSFCKSSFRNSISELFIHL